MSGTVTNGGSQTGPSPSGRGSLGGGTDVVNQPVLPLPASTFDCVTDQQLHALKLIQLEFSRDVSAAAATAYEKIIAEFRRTDGQHVR